MPSVNQTRMFVRAVTPQAIGVWYYSRRVVVKQRSPERLRPPLT